MGCIVQKAVMVFIVSLNGTGSTLGMSSDINLNVNSSYAPIVKIT